MHTVSLSEERIIYMINLVKTHTENHQYTKSNILHLEIQICLKIIFLLPPELMRMYTKSLKQCHLSLNYVQERKLAINFIHCPFTVQEIFFLTGTKILCYKCVIHIHIYIYIGQHIIFTNLHQTYP